jgi:hypothetical protein
VEAWADGYETVRGTAICVLYETSKCGVKLQSPTPQFDDDDVDRSEP